ncbi:hypothetical protein ACFOUP_02765 [Belliella kenyensis]|uniref:TolB-like 6-blade propeller-like n=1 Tax=Belliella kenyensis TaxID=1472724 RepID=A0ABV8EHN2_9BACT|nr:hypothetical protein [Belliella kenyensis]MCH7402467.1 hypothetical protein [Belliella kenyensis]MDN3603658.1 hypothetical protein [Belliella kenyensis]
MKEELGFFQKPDKISLVSDSVIVAYSGFSGLSIYNIFTGQQLDYLDPKRNPKRSLWISSIDAEDLSSIYMLEARQNKIYVYNYFEKKLVKEIPLSLDSETSIRVLGGKFKVYKGKFYVELSPAGTPMLDPNYYKNSGKFIGVFDSAGTLEKRIIDYPKQLTNPEGYFVPDNYYSFNFYGDKMYICFPFEKIVRVYDLESDWNNFQSIPIPSLDYMEMDLIYIPNKFLPNEIPVEVRQISAKVSEIVVDESYLYLAFAINDNENNDRFREYSTVFKFDLKEMKWYAQNEPIDYYEIGSFAGVSGEKLVFLDAAVVIKDEKFINLATIE